MRSVKHNLFDAFPYSFRRDIDATMPKYAVVQGTERNIAAQVAKFDAVVSDVWRSDPLFLRAVEFVTEMYRPALTCGVVSWPDALAEFDYTKSPGVPFTGYGFRTKEQVIAYPDEFVEFCIKSVNMEAKVVFGTVPKTEFLLITEILADKIRLFSPGPFHFLATQSRLYSEQNRRLKNFAWSGYGFNLFRGGCNSLAKSLQSLGPCFDLDIPRCDKSFPLMEIVYNMRNSMLQNTTAFDVRSMQWVASNLSNCYMLLPDGTVVESPNVNPSGQLNTTPDNILYVSIVLCYALLTADPNATFAEVMAQKIKIFGDDVHGGISPQFKQFNEPGWLVRFLKEKFNLNLTSCHFYPDAVGLHWLGADYGYLRGTNIIVPFYNKDRLWDAWRYTEKGNMAEWQTLSKLRSVLILAYPHFDLFNMFSACYTALLRELAGSKDSTTQAILRLGTPSSNELYAFYTGHENFALGVSSHFSQALKEVGGVKSIWMNAKQSVKKVVGNGPQEKQKQRVASRAGLFKQQLRDSASQRDVTEAVKNLTRSGTGTRSDSTGGGSSGQLARLGVGRGQEVRPKVNGNVARIGGVALKQPKMKKRLRVGMCTVVHQPVAPTSEEVALAKKLGNPVPLPKSEVVAQLPVNRFLVGSSADIPKQTRIPDDIGGRHHGLSHTEYEFIEGGKHHVRAIGQTWLCAVNVTTATGTGQTLKVKPIAASWLGGRLTALASLFEQSSVKEFKLEWRSVTGDLEPGGVMLSFVNDESVEFLDTGDAWLQRITDFQQFVDTLVRKSATLSIDPSTAVKRQFNVSDSDATVVTAGIVIVVTTADLAVKAMGHVYVQYDIDFFEDYIDTTVNAIATGTIHMGSAAATLTAGAAYAPVTAAALGANAFGTATVSTSAPAGAYVISMTCTSNASTVGDFVVANEYHPGGITASTGLDKGHTLFARSVIVDTSAGSITWTNGTIRLALFTNWEDAWGGDDQSALPGISNYESNLLNVLSASNPVSNDKSYDCTFYPIKAT
jgi:hypothetical protein